MYLRLLATLLQEVLAKDDIASARAMMEQVTMPEFAMLPLGLQWVWKEKAGFVQRERDI